LVEVIETLLGKGHTIRIFDRNVTTSRLIGANRQFMEDHIPHLSSLLVESAEELATQSEVIVIGYKSPDFMSTFESLRSDQIVIDFARLGDGGKTLARYEGICW
jgi:GDP-mannose 6-dehydrogenase